MECDFEITNIDMPYERFEYWQRGITTVAGFIRREMRNAVMDGDHIDSIIDSGGALVSVEEAALVEREELTPQADSVCAGSADVGGPSDMVVPNLGQLRGSFGTVVRDPGRGIDHVPGLCR